MASILLERLGRDERLHLGVLARGLEVLADGEEVHVGRAQVVHHLQHLLARLAEAHHDARLGEQGGGQLLHPLQQPQGVEVACAGPDPQIERRHRLQVVVVDIGCRCHDRLQRAVLAQEVRGEHLDRGVGRQPPDGADGGGEVGAAAVGKVVAVHRGDDDVIEAELGHSLRHVLGLRGVERAGQPGLDVAEGAGARAGVAHDHHGGVAPGPALGDVGAAGLLAHRMEAVLAQDGPRLRELRRGRRQPHPDPVGLPQHRRVGLVRLLGVARARVVEDGDHGAPGGPPMAAASRRWPARRAKIKMPPAAPDHGPPSPKQHDGLKR